MHALARTLTLRLLHPCWDEVISSIDELARLGVGPQRTPIVMILPKGFASHGGVRQQSLVTWQAHDAVKRAKHELELLHGRVCRKEGT